jgi:hypothetical protein
MACDLTTLALVKTYMGIPVADASKDALINQLIPALSAAIATYTDRNFCLTDYRDYVETVYGNILYLPQYPVTKLKRIVLCLVNVIKVKTTRAGCRAASVELFDGEVITQQWGDNEAEGNIDLAIQDTFTKLKTALEALAGQAWSAEIVSGYESHLSADLVEMPGQPALSPDYAELLIPDYDSMFYNYRLNQDNGRVESLRESFPDGRVFAEYTAGFGATPADMPADLVELATKIVATAAREAKHDITLTGERLGDYSWSAGNTALTAIELLDRFIGELARWRRVSLG